ncbi:MAG: FHA domain-containing protein [Ruminococcaceae bacterium]|nr:FHA domain-containing protein [Oscillospiraceae bacterium]
MEIKKKADASPVNQEKMCELPTELLSCRQELFRLATLSEGMIGTKAETAGQRAFILNDEFIIGRDSRSVDLCLTGYAIGRQHARITRQGAAFFITDLGSKNGTHLNGERLNKMETILLPDTCQLQFADRLFYFEAEKLPVGA